MTAIPEINADWTLFLDRDGVINQEKNNDYIHSWEEFVFYEAVLEAFGIFAKKFNHIIVVTNQRGVGKGVTKVADLEIIHCEHEHAIPACGGQARCGILLCRYG